MKKCSKCGETRHISDFYFKNKKFGVRRSDCKFCQNDYQRLKYYSKPKRDRTADMRSRKYALRSSDISFLLEGQNNACAICFSSITESTCHVDHDHACCSGVVTCGNCVRGLLCASCNSGLGFFKDDPGRILNAARYLQQDVERARMFRETMELATRSIQNMRNTLYQISLQFPTRKVSHEDSEGSG